MAQPHLRVLRADGQRIDLGKRETGALLTATRQSWQQQSYAYRDLIGELRFAMRLLSRSVSRVRFYAAETRPWPQDPAPLDGDEHGLDKQLAADAVYNFERLPMDSNPDGFTARLTENLSIAGEAWVHLDPDGQWWVRSTSEITASTDGRVTLSGLPGGGMSTGARVIDPAKEDLLRLWVPHPEWGQLADSPMRALLDIAEDVVLAGREQRASARSRLAANGILFIPDSMSLVRERRTSDDEDGFDDDSVTSDTFMHDFTEAVLASIKDDADPQAVVPLIIRGDKDDIAAVKHIRIERADSEQLVERQSSAILRLLKGLDIQPEQVEGIGSSNHWCVDDQTEILTTHGWLSGEKVAPGDVALTLNHDTGLSEWQPVEHIYRANVVDEPMVAMGGRRHSSLTTLNHRWPVLHDRGGKNCNVGGEVVDGRHKRREWATSETLNRRCWIPTAARAGDQPDTPKYTDELVELTAWFWTEGNIGNSGGVAIAQSHTVNPLRVDRIRACLTRMFGPASPSLTDKLTTTPRWREYVQRNDSSYGGPITVFRLCREARLALLDVAPDKLVSLDFIRALTPAQLELFIDISAQGDGWHYRSGRLDMWQKNPAALDAYELALILSGRMVTRGESGGGYWVAPHNRGQVNPPKASELAVNQGRTPLVAREYYTGTVWCPTTANGTWFARRQGTAYYTGNSAWLIEAQSVRHQVQPAAETVAAGLAAAYLRPALSGTLGHDPEQVSRVTIGVDVTPLSENPNRGQDARDAHERGVISDEALREALSFDEDDAPSDEEVVKRLARDGRLPVEVSAQILGLTRPEREQITVQGEAVRPAIAAPAATPAAQPGQLHPARTTPAEPTRETPPGPVVAAAAPEFDGWVVNTDGSRRLADIDAALTERITVAGDAALARVVERAGAKVRTKVRNDAALTASIANVEPHLIPSALGRERVEGFVPVADLIADSYGRLRGQVEGWLADAAGQAGEVACAVLALDPHSTRGTGVRKAVTSRLATHTRQAWAVLANGLEEAAEDALFDPEPAPDDGESASGLLSPQAVMDALAVAGGDTATVTASALLDPDTDDLGSMARQERRARKRRPVKRRKPAAPVTGPATGPAVRGVIAEYGGVELGWQWHYNTHIPRATFDPHKQLDGQRFTSWRDDVLLTDPSTAWIGTHFHVGDHRGDRCTASPIVAVVEDPESVMAQALRDAHGDPSKVLFGGDPNTPRADRDTAGLRARVNAAVDAMRTEHINRKGGRR